MVNYGGNQDKNTLDDWKITLIHLVYTICGSMLSERFFAGLLTGTAPIDAFAQTMEKLGDMPNRGEDISIRLRGLKTGPRTSIDLDYQISTGEVRIDLQEAMSIAKRRGSAMMHLPGQLHKAWEVFKNYGITSVIVRLLEPPRDHLDLFRSSIHFLSRYYQALEYQQPLHIDMGEERQEIPIIHNDEDQPDPNLTLFAYLNNMGQDDVTELISQARQFAKQKESSETSLDSSPHPVEILARMSSFQKELEIPPIRVNTIKWVAIKEEEVRVPKGQLDAAGAVEQVYGDDEEKMDTLLSYITGPGLDVRQAEQFGRGLLEISDFLMELEGFEEAREVEEELKGKVVKLILALPEELLARMTVDSVTLKISQPGQEPLEIEIVPEFAEALHSRIHAISQGKTGKLDVYEKLKNIHDRKTVLSRSDLMRLSRDFHVPLDEVHMFLSSLRRCFDRQGNFDRARFVQHGTILALYTNQAYPLFIHYLKTTEERTSRVSLVNCLPALFDKTEQPRKVVETLLKEFCVDPDQIYYFDRNLLMVTTQILRHYRKEKEVEIEKTPEEVILVEKGLVEEAVQLARRTLDDLTDEIQQKVYTMRYGLIESLGRSDKARGDDFAPEFLSSLLREFYILMTLIGGVSAKALLRDAALAFSNPESRIYNQPESGEFTSNIFRLFRIIVKGSLRLVRQAEEDHHYLDTLRANIQALMVKAEEENQQRLLQQTLDLVAEHFSTVKEV
jgi:hypothetical protein